jgi:uncharacterized protein with PIN domain
MATATIYARVSEQTKDAAESYASERGLTLAGALHELLVLGLESAENVASVTALQSKVSSLDEEVVELKMALREHAVAREHAEHQRDALRQAAEIWGHRADLTVGTCPNCGQPLTGADLLVVGRCQSCKQSTSALMEPSGSNLNSRDFMLALGAVGIMLGLVALAANSGKG